MTDKNYNQRQVGYYMSRFPLTAKPQDFLLEACRVMSENNISCLIVEYGNIPVGVLSERSIVRWFSGSGGPEYKNPCVKDVMRKPPVCIQPKKTVMEALSLMRENHIRRLVVTERKKIVGLVTQSDLLESTKRLLLRSEKKHERLAVLSQKDSLTDVFNRQYFEAVFKKEISRAMRYGGLLSLVIFDIDNFKTINDTLGHVAGDSALKKVSGIINELSRGADIVSRYGGDEFMVLVPAMGTRGTKIYAERVRKRIERTFNDKQIKITVSAGICKWSPFNNTMKEMIKKADQCLYWAKKNGKNKVGVWTNREENSWIK